MGVTSLMVGLPFYREIGNLGCSISRDDQNFMTPARQDRNIEDRNMAKVCHIIL